MEGFIQRYSWSIDTRLRGYDIFTSDLLTKARIHKGTIYMINIKGEIKC